MNSTDEINGDIKATVLVVITTEFQCTLGHYNSRLGPNYLSLGVRIVSGATGLAGSIIG